MTRLARTEIGLALGALGLAVIASLYLVISFFGANETCYGLQETSLVCTKLQPGTTDYAQEAARLGFVVVTVLLLYIGTALGAWWHHRAKEPSARSAALGLLITCALLALCMTVPAISGAGFFYFPSTLLSSLAALVGLGELVLEWRSPSVSPDTPPATPQPREVNSPEA